MRPVKFLPNGKIDMIGSFEQVYMNIACQNDTIIPGLTTHQEISPHNMLSVLANLTPFSDHNQSPRNMYQCQVMSKILCNEVHVQITVKLIDVYPYYLVRWQSKQWERPLPPMYTERIISCTDCKQVKHP